MDTLKQSLILNAQNSAKQLLVSAKYIPDDKFEWSPGGAARSTLAILQECAGFPNWIQSTIEAGEMPGFDPEAYAAFQATIGTREAVVLAIQASTEKMVEFIEALPEDAWNKQFTFPWGTYDTAGVLAFYAWNNTYHTGQINYQQLILGDTEMHSS